MDMSVCYAVHDEGKAMKSRGRMDTAFLIKFSWLGADPTLVFHLFVSLLEFLCKWEADQNECLMGPRAASLHLVRGT